MSSRLKAAAMKRHRTVKPEENARRLLRLLVFRDSLDFARLLGHRDKGHVVLVE
jgi:DNA modification methylase